MVYIDNKLNWKTHVSYAGGVRRGIGVLIKARKYFNSDCMINLYYAFIYLTSCIAITYGEILIKQTFSKLQVLQNKAVRILTGSSRRSHIENMYKCNGIMNLDFINICLVGKFIYKVYHKDVPTIFDDFFRHNDHFHDQCTRTANHSHVPFASTNLSKTGIRYQGFIVWNKILYANINPDSSEQSFEMMLKKCITQQLLAI